MELLAIGQSSRSDTYIYAASAWRGLASTSDRQRIDSVIDLARRNGYCASDLYHLLMNYVMTPTTGADPGVEIKGGHMASAERESIMGVWRLCPQRGPGAEPLVRGSGGEAPLKLNAFWCCHMSKMALNCYVL